MSNRQERMRAVFALVDTVVTEPPCAFVADVTFPVAPMRESLANVAKDACFQSVCGVVF